MTELESNAEWEAERARHVAAFRRAAAPLLRDLEEAGIATEDYGRYVNRPVPGVLEPARFDEAAATPILLRWLPKMQDLGVKQTIVRHLKNKAARGVATEALVAEFRVADADDLRWVIGDTLQSVATKAQYPTLVELAADARYGRGRAPLLDILRRVKTDAAVDILRRALEDPDVALVAGTALRRAVGNEVARDAFALLTDHGDDVVRRAARENLKTSERAIARQRRP